jgi:methionyl-tRNA formyltransferase
MPYSVAFAGTPAFTIPTLQMLLSLENVQVPFVLTQPDKPVGRAKTMTPSPVSEFALRNNLTVLKAERLADIQKELESYSIDLLVVIAYGVLFPDWLLILPKKGCINIHYSLLPDLRGASPIQSALLKGYTETGLSIFKLISKMDAGDILFQEKIKIRPEYTYTDLKNRFENKTPETLKSMLFSYLNDELKPTSQDHEKATFCYTIKKEDGRIDWRNATAEDIYNKYCAFIEWPGIYSTWNGELLKFLEIKLTDQQEGTPGRIIMDEEKLYIGTQTNDIEIISLQKAGKKPTNAAEFIRGYVTSISKNPFLV